MVDKATGAKAPDHAELVEALIEQISERVGRYLERRRRLVRDPEHSYLAFDTDPDDPMAQALGNSVTYRIAVGPRAGQKAFALQTVAPIEAGMSDRLARAHGFALHAGVATQAWERRKLERLARYVTRPAVSKQRLSLTTNGPVRYELKMPYRDGTIHVFFEPMNFIARLAALIPKPRVNLIRYHGVFAPNSVAHRAAVPPASRGRQPVDIECTLLYSPLCPPNALAPVKSASCNSTTCYSPRRGSRPLDGACSGYAGYRFPHTPS